MDAQELRNLQEAYMEVVMENRDWKRSDWKRVPLSNGRGSKLVYAPPKENRAQEHPNQAKKQRPETRDEGYDYYDIILSHLLDEGYAETPEAAEAIMVNMSEEWRESIVENVSSGRSKVRNVKQRVSSVEIISNTQKQKQEQDKIAQHFADHAAKKKSAGDEAHAAATKAGKSPSDAETARQRAHRAYEKQLKRG